MRGLGWCLAGAGEGAGGEEAAGADDVVEPGAGDEGTTGGVAGGVATEAGLEVAQKLAYQEGAELMLTW